MRIVSAAQNRVALWSPSHRSRVSSEQYYSIEGSIGEPLWNADGDGSRLAGERVVHLGLRVVQLLSHLNQRANDHSGVASHLARLMHVAVCVCVSPTLT